MSLERPRVATHVQLLFTALSEKFNQKSAIPQKSTRKDSMEQLDVVIVLTTWPAAQDPVPMATALVEERLAACVNLLPEMASIYRWNDAVEREQERQVLIKTTRPRVDALLARLQHLHPYEVPEMLVLPVAGGSVAYIEWIGAATRP